MTDIPPRRGNLDTDKMMQNTEDSNLTNEGERSGIYHFLVALRRNQPW